MIAKNNFLNIRFSPMQTWKGQVGSNKGFCEFGMPVDGWRAALKLLCNYCDGGHDTVRKIISRWAPPSENDTERYISFVASRIGLNPDEPLSSRFQLCELAAAMAQMETATLTSPHHLYELMLKFNLSFKASHK